MPLAAFRGIQYYLFILTPIHSPFHILKRSFRVFYFISEIVLRLCYSKHYECEAVAVASGLACEIRVEFETKS